MSRPPPPPPRGDSARTVRRVEFSSASCSQHENRTTSTFQSSR